MTEEAREGHQVLAYCPCVVLAALKQLAHAFEQHRKGGDDIRDSTPGL